MHQGSDSVLSAVLSVHIVPSLLAGIGTVEVGVELGFIHFVLSFNLDLAEQFVPFIAGLGRYAVEVVLQRCQLCLHIQTGLFDTDQR